MLGRPSGIVLLAAAFLVAGLAGIAAFWVATVSRTPGTSEVDPILWTGFRHS